MKIVLLADSNSTHIIKWAISLAQKEVDIVIISLSENIINDYSHYKNICLYNLSIDKNNVESNKGIFSKLNYLKKINRVKQIIKEEKPDIVHAHYASSYGLLGALSGFHPYVVSVWGSDVFDFPKKNIINKIILKYNLRKADKILSTSNIMARETAIYTEKDIEVTPFGIDVNVFKPFKHESIFSENDIVIGTVKALEKEYGIDYLIKAFKKVVDENKDLPLKLLIVGTGSLETELIELIKDLNLNNKTIFTGKVPFNEVAKYHNMIDIPVFVSNNESFGVAVIEASACEKPVVVSNIGGLPEVVDENVTGIIVSSKNEQQTAKAIEKLLLDNELSKKMGKAGRERVKKLYNWNDNVKQMISVYKNILNK